MSRTSISTSSTPARSAPMSAGSRDEMVADQSMASLDVVQKELQSIRAERRRRRRALTRLSDSASSRLTPSVAATCSTRSWTDDSPSTLSGVTKHEHGRIATRHVVERYCSASPFPPELMRAAYVPHPNGNLVPCPKHQMGSLVESVDLGPWAITEERVDMLAGNRHVAGMGLDCRSSYYRIRDHVCLQTECNRGRHLEYSGS